MKIVNFLILLFLILSVSDCSQSQSRSLKPEEYTLVHSKTPKITMEQLDRNFFNDWNRPEYNAADSASSIQYLTDRERKVFYYLNLARMNPQLFARTYAISYMGEQKYLNYSDFDEKKESLISDLNHLNKLHPLSPSHEMYELAKCHAAVIGEKGIKTHDRNLSGCSTGMLGENIAYGNLNALEIIMSLLIDTRIENLGHRKILLSSEYDSMGVSIQKHITDGAVVVLDFK